MVLSHSLPLSGITILASSFFLISLLTSTLSQTTPTDPSEAPTVAECGPRLLPLASCGPFVQGQSLAPTQQCCDNLKEMYSQQHGCLCLFLNGTALATLPINGTRALELPGLCSPQIDPSTCSASVNGGPTAPGSPAAQVSFKKKPRPPPGEKAPMPPTDTLAPGPSSVRFGMGRSAGYKQRSGDHSGVLVAVISLLLAKLM